jgi:solute carrier family 7 (cationic amino acid transporter), member 1
MRCSNSFCYSFFLYLELVQEALDVSEVAREVRRQKAIGNIVLICVGAINLFSAVSISFLPL